MLERPPHAVEGILTKPGNLSLGAPHREKIDCRHWITVLDEVSLQGIAKENLENSSIITNRYLFDVLDCKVP